MAYPQTLSLDGSALSNDFCDDIATHGRGGGGVVCGVLLERGEVALDKTLDARKSEGMAGHNQMARRRMSGARAPFRSQSRLAHDCDLLCRKHRGMARGRRVPGRRRRQRHVEACVWVTVCVCAFRWGRGCTRICPSCVGSQTDGCSGGLSGPVLEGSPTGGCSGMHDVSEPPTQFCDAEKLLYTSGPAPSTVVGAGAGAVTPPSCTPFRDMVVPPSCAAATTSGPPSPYGMYTVSPWGTSCVSRKAPQGSSVLCLGTHTIHIERQLRARKYSAPRSWVVPNRHTSRPGTRRAQDRRGKGQGPRCRHSYRGRR